MSNLKITILSLLMISLMAVSCTGDEDPDFKITSLSFDESSVEVVVGATLDLTDLLAIVGEDASKAEITLTSNNEDVVTVSGTTLTAIAVGNAVIEASEANTNQTATISVTVVPSIIDATGITISPSTILVTGNEEVQLSASIAPADATDQSVTWTLVYEPTEQTGRGNVEEPELTAEDFATLDPETQKLTGHKACDDCGLYVVATANGGEEVSEKLPVEIVFVSVSSITLDPSKPFEAFIGKPKQMTYTVDPSNATNQEVEWEIVLVPNGSCQDSRTLAEAPEPISDYATIDENGVITPIKRFSKECDRLGVRVSATDDSEPPFKEVGFEIYELTESITIVHDDINVNTGSLAFNGCSPTFLQFETTPEETSHNVTWTSSNPDLLAVSADGVLSLGPNVSSPTTAKIQITVTATDGSGKSHTIDVNVGYNIGNCI